MQYSLTLKLSEPIFKKAQISHLRLSYALPFKQTFSFSSSKMLKSLIMNNLERKLGYIMINAIHLYLTSL